MIGTRACKKPEPHQGVIPLLVEGTKNTAFPAFMVDSVNIDFTEHKNYFIALFRLILRLHNIPYDYPGLDKVIQSMAPNDHRH